MSDLNLRNTYHLEKWFHTDSTVCVPPSFGVTGTGRILAMFRAIFKKYTFITWEVKEVFRLSENRYIIFSESEGCFKTETPYLNKLVTDVCFNEDGQIDFLSDYFKNTALFHQS